MDDVRPRSLLDPMRPALDAASVRSGEEVALAPCVLRGQIDLRLGGEECQASERVEHALGVSLPREPNCVSSSATTTVMWLGPDEWLVFSDMAETVGVEARLREALESDWGAVVDVSANRIGVVISGPRAQEVLSTCCALDVGFAAFPRGTCAQTLLGRAIVLIHRVDRSAFEIWVRPSYARYLSELLLDACLPHLVADEEPVTMTRALA